MSNEEVVQSQEQPKIELTEIQREWVAALRSGKYEQAKHVLRTADNKFCCLGVLCELAVKHDIIHQGTQIEPNCAYQYGEDNVLPPSIVADWVGLADRGTHYDGRLRRTQLTADNDSGKTFLEIADIIEQHADTLFKR